MPICFAHKRILQLRREIFFVRHEGVHARFWTRSFLHGSLYSENLRSTCKNRASIACHIPEPRPFACCVPKRFLLLFLLRSDLVSHATKAYLHGCGRGLFCMDRFYLNLIEAHAKTAHRSLVRSLNAVPLPVACRSAFCCCCEVILFHTPQRRTCTVLDAVFCMDPFSLNIIEVHAKTARR